MMPAAQSAHPGGLQTPGSNANILEMEPLLGKCCFQNLLNTTPGDFTLDQRGGRKGERAGRAPRRSPTPAAQVRPGAWGQVGSGGSAARGRADGGGGASGGGGVGEVG